MEKGINCFKALLDGRGTFNFPLFLVESLIRLDRYKSFNRSEKTVKYLGLQAKENE